MTYYFLKEDLAKLDDEIARTEKVYRESGKSMGDACSQSSETFHDNAPFEEAQRQMHLFGSRLSELVEIKRNACVVEVDQSLEKVLIGKVVTIEDDTGVVCTVTIGSYSIFNDQTKNTISYTSPLAKIIYGAKKGQTKEGVIAGKKKRFKILNII